MACQKKRIKDLILTDSNECWIWQGSVKGTGLRSYGNMIIGSRKDKTRKSCSAHRYSYQVFNGIIPGGSWVLHKCDVPRCVNPEHLFLGNRKINVDDRESKKRNKMEQLRKPGEDHVNAVLNWNIVNYIRISTKSALSLSRELNINRSTVRNVLNFKTWISEKPE